MADYTNLGIGTPEASTPVNLQPPPPAPVAPAPSLSPDLQAIIRQVTSYATGRGGPGGQTAAQGRALLGIMDKVAGVQSETAATNRAIMGETGATERTGLGIRSAEKIAGENQALKKEELGLERTKLLGIGGKGAKPLVSDSSPASANWWDTWKL